MVKDIWFTRRHVEYAAVHEIADRLPQPVSDEVQIALQAAFDAGRDHERWVESTRREVRSQWGES